VFGSHELLNTKKGKSFVGFAGSQRNGNPRFKCKAWTAATA
jgi:hypothetical protein